MAVRGDDPMKVRQRVGHEQIATTERYIRVAEEVRGGSARCSRRVPGACA